MDFSSDENMNVHLLDQYIFNSESNLSINYDFDAIFDEKLADPELEFAFSDARSYHLYVQQKIAAL